MNQGHPFLSELDMAGLSQQDIHNMMILYNHVHDLDNQAAAPPHEGTVSDQEPAEDVHEHQAQPTGAEDQGHDEHKEDHMATNNVSFDFDDLLNLEGSPDHMYDADLAPKHLQEQNNWPATHTQSDPEMAHLSTMAPETTPVANTTYSTATDGSEVAVMKHSPPNYDTHMSVEALPNQPSPPEFKDPSIRQMSALQSHHRQVDTSSEQIQGGQIHSIQQPLTSCSRAQGHPAPSPNPAPINTVDAAPVQMEEAWDAEESQYKPGRKAGKSKEKSPSTEPKDERANLRDSDEPILLQFSSSQEANDYRPDRRPMPADPTVPRTVAQKKECVVMLIRAMKSVENATDNWGMIKPFVNRKFTDRKIEVCCWNILDCCISRQSAGPFLTPEEEALKNKTKKNTQNFAERFGDMIRILRARKTVCRHLLDPYYLLQFVDDPSSCLSRVDSNKTLNAKKKQAIDEGKKVIAKRVAGEDTATTADDAAPTLASPFTTPKADTHTTDANSRDPHMDRDIIPSIETPRMSQPTANASQINLQASPIVSMQPGARQQAVLGSPVGYSTYPFGNVGSAPSIGYPLGHAYNSAHGAAGNMGYHNMGTMMNAPQVNAATSPPRSPWNHVYSNTIPATQYQMPPRTPNLPSLTSQFPSPPVTAGAASPNQAKPARKTSRKRSADGSDRPESPMKKGRR
ncbi:hypothetical protein FQN49_004419 [Arthroderma sp. PD_2]|nr:hypothetical protein FQN49_004419 [Arthroderma sp. PD_2]